MFLFCLENSSFRLRYVLNFSSFAFRIQITCIKSHNRLTGSNRSSQKADFNNIYFKPLTALHKIFNLRETSIVAKLFKVINQIVQLSYYSMTLLVRNLPTDCFRFISMLM